MKSILLMPVKNEEWIIGSTLEYMHDLFDHIIISDQESTDNTIETTKKFSNITYLKNTRKLHSNIVRWELLENSRRLFGNHNLIACIDADELIPKKLYLNQMKNILKEPPGTVFYSSWVQLWRSINQYRNDNSVWNPKKNIKEFMFIDNGSMNYERTETINDHTTRIPNLGVENKKKLNFPLLHLQFVNWERSQLKQVWYMCNEKVAGNNSEDINSKYINSQNENNIKLSRTKKKWLSDFLLNEEILKQDHFSEWYVKEIDELFSKHGVEEFLELNIWHLEKINDLKQTY